MLSKVGKADVLHNVTVEMKTMFGVLTNHYSRPERVVGLPELEKVEAFLLAKLAEYDPIYEKIFTEGLKE
ncbi:MAG: hypothetical protein WBC19_10660 [Pyrinomonadaceae bacterium]|nr:hypothetical protein [Chloracidobacterium sp.]